MKYALFTLMSILQNERHSEDKSGCTMVDQVIISCGW